MFMDARSTGWSTLTNTIRGYNPGALYVFAGRLGSGAMQLAAHSSGVKDCIVLQRGDQQEFDKKMPEFLKMAAEHKGILIDAREVPWQHRETTAYNAAHYAGDANVPVFIVAQASRNTDAKNVGMDLSFYCQFSNALMFVEREQFVNKGVATIHVVKARHNTYFDKVNRFSPNGGKTYVEWSMQDDEIVFGKEINQFS